jgi:uncharacterized protein (TIGR03437 family)
MRCTVAALAVLALVSPAPASEADALAISANIQAKHLPFGGIIDPVYASPTSGQIVGYTRCGDSALWTGAYLAAESFRYNVTQSADALQNVKNALAALKGLADVTGDNRLARCMMQANWPFAAGVESEEAANTINQNPPWVWVDNTSRDQIVGAFFGLGIAYDVVNDAGVKQSVSDLATRLAGYISDHQWSPNNDITSTLMLRPEELQMLLQVARHVNPSNTVSGPFVVAPVETAVLVDVQDNSSYFKFNLDYMTFYHLVLLQNNGPNRDAYEIVRNYTASHQNAFFDIIDRALNGPDATRDAEARYLLDQWLNRPSRDFYTDLTNSVKVCGTEACDPIPVAWRVNTDFLWQRDPFQLSGGGEGTIETAGVDYILPYWMGRYYGVIPSNTIQSAAAPTSAVAPDSLASLYGTDLAPASAAASSQPLPVTLGGVTISVRDAGGVTRSAPLVYVSPGQINFIVPDGTATGLATFVVTSGATAQIYSAMVQPVVPTFFSLNGAGSGIAAATAVVTQAANPSQQSPVELFECIASTCAALPVTLSTSTSVYVTFYGTGIRNYGSLANVAMTINGISVPVLYAGPSPNFAGIDQVNVSLPLTLRGSGTSNVLLTADGQQSNVVTITIQ